MVVVLEGGGAGCVGGIVQHIDSSVNERKMTDDGGRGQRKTAVRTYLGETVGHGNYYSK